MNLNGNENFCVDERFRQDVKFQSDGEGSVYETFWKLMTIIEDILYGGWVVVCACVCVCV